MDTSSTFPDVQGIEDDKENNLWVEKYRPMCYTHLLSEEVCNTF